jgi:hypothetical protein
MELRMVNAERPALAQSVTFYRAASITLFAVLACIVVLTFRQYGITWDEPGQNRYGSLVDRYYLDLFHGRYNLAPIVDDYNFGYYGGLFDSIAAGLEHISPFGEFETRHLLNAMVGLLGILGCWKMARLLGGYAAGFWAALLLAVTPRYYGPMFNNPKDIPFAVGYVWTVYLLLLAIPLLPKIPWRLCLKLGVVIGLTLGIRVGALLLLAYVGAIQAAYLVWAVMRQKTPGTLRADIALTLSRFAAIAIPAWMIMLAFWPWAQANPFRRPFQALSYFNTFPWNGAVLFHGKQMQATSLPRTYTLEWLGITLPEGVLVLFALAIVLGVRAIWIKRRSLLQDIVAARYSFAAFALLFPLAYIFITRPVLYDAERHSLYLVPILICLCGATWAWVLSRLFASSRAFAFVLAAVFVAYLSWHVSVLVRLHPQEYVFFNQAAGGLAGAAANYETDYWGNSYREAVNILVRHVQPERQKDPQKRYRIYMTSAQRASATYYFPPYFSLTFTPKDADFFLATTRYNVQNTVEGCTVGAVERFGVPLAVIKDLRCSNTLPATADGTLQGNGPKGL